MQNLLAATNTASVRALIGPAACYAGVCTLAESMYQSCVLGRCANLCSIIMLQTPWARPMSQQSQTVYVLAWTVQRIKRTGNKLYYIFEIQLKKPNYVSTTQHAGNKIPVNPWSKLASDIFHIEGNSYPLIVDYTSRFPIIRKLSSVTGKAIAHHMQSLLNMDGLTH